MNEIITTCITTVSLSFFLITLAANARVIFDQLFNGYSWFRDKVGLWN